MKNKKYIKIWIVERIQNAKYKFGFLKILDFWNFPKYFEHFRFFSKVFWLFWMSRIWPSIIPKKIANLTGMYYILLLVNVNGVLSNINGVPRGRRISANLYEAHSGRFWLRTIARCHISLISGVSIMTLCDVQYLLRGDPWRQL